MFGGYRTCGITGVCTNAEDEALVKQLMLPGTVCKGRTQRNLLRRSGRC